MKKSTKVIATIVAVVLVVTAMVVAIYAATAGNVGINANVSWTAQEGVNLEFWATVTGGDQEKSVAKSTIAPTTANANAKIQGDLSCSFKDDSDDGVNNPGAITFKYYVKNNSLTPLNIRVTDTPEAGAESGTSASDHKPKVELSSSIDGGTSTLNAVRSTSGCELTAGKTFEYSVVLSMASGGTGTIDANTGLMKDFNAGVNFLFNVGNETNGNIITQIDSSSPVTVASSTVSGQTLGEYLSTIEPEYCAGWFFDEGLTKAVTEQNLNASLRDSASASLYTKTASTTGLTFTLSDDGNSYLVKGESTTSPSGAVVIPYKYNGKPVSGCVVNGYEGGAFTYNYSITSVVIPSLMTSMDDFMFTGCHELTSIIIPDSVLYIDYGSFDSCHKLTSIIIPDSVISIGQHAFRSCDALTSVIIGSGVKEISDAFWGCSKLISIEVSSGNTKYDSRNNCNAIIATSSDELVFGFQTTIIPDTVKSIGNNAFNGCSELKSIIIPDSVTSIGDSAFQNCSGLMSVIIGSGVTSIGDSAFYLCSGLTSVIIGANVTSIGTGAFHNCSGLTSITLPDSVISIGDSAFYSCSGLTSIILPNSIKTIRRKAFYGCEKLTKIYIPSSVTTILASSYYYSPFYKCSSTLKIYCEANRKPNDWDTYWNYYDESKTLTIYLGKTLADFNAA